MTRFIDVHVHPPVPQLLEGAFATFLPDLERYFGRQFPQMDIDTLADYYAERDGRAVLLAWDASTATGRQAFTSETVAALVASHPERFVGFGAVDPHRGEAAVSGVHQAAQLGLKGLKFHAPAQRFLPSERQFYSIFSAAQERRLICLFHSGFTGLGAGGPGGHGVRLGLGDPMHVDEVAAEFPRLRIVLAHPSWPWQDQALAVARHKPNVYLELSGWSPKYFDTALLDAITGPLQDRVLFGTDFPFLTPDKWLRDWEELGIPEEVSRKILHDNAARLLELED
ncbi:MAG TPA: amidohydrolase family protein [Acidimicrobiia bacterium]